MKTTPMNFRAASLFFAFTLVTIPIQAQGPTVESLASDLAALTARVAKLEGQIVAADLVGTYAIHGIQNELSASGGPAQISSYVFLGTVTLAADGTASLNFTQQNGNTLVLGPQSSVQPFQGSGNPPTNIDWTYADGAVAILGGSVSLSVAAGGRVLVGASANHSDGTNVLLIFTRLQ